jgi:membrane fusion protein, adhesin transport system
MHDMFNSISRDPKHRILHQSHFQVHALLWISMGIVAITLVWCCIAELDEITRSDHASIVPSGQTKVIQSLEGGIIKRIFVAEGQAVYKNEVLAEIDDISAQTQLEKNTMHIQALQLRCTRLLAEITNQPFHLPHESCMIKENAIMMSNYSY